jgi:chemotaxis protein MotB
MIENKNNEERGASIVDMPTGEYPVLDLGDIVDTVSVERPTAAESVKAALWLAHLESEVERLHARWQHFDLEFKAREARIAELHQEVEARETTIHELTAEVQREMAAVAAAEERVASKDREIAALADDRRQRDERIAALATELADAEVARKSTFERIARVEAETVQLNDTLRAEQMEAVTLREQNNDLLAEQVRLRGQVQDLEIYINGRHDRWSDVNAQLDDYKGRALALAEDLKQRDAAMLELHAEKDRLIARLFEVERESAELTARRKEREDANDALQRQIAAQLALAEQLKAEQSDRIQEARQAAAMALEARSRIESLELGVKDRDSNIEALSAEIARGAVALSELGAAKDELSARIERLEKELAERGRQTEALRDELRMSHDQLQVAQQQLSERTMQLASSQQTMEQKARHIERLSNDAMAMHKDAVAARAAIEKLQMQAIELENRRNEAAAEADQLRREIVARETRIATLEAELRVKQATEDLLERSVERITGIGASLAALDQQMTDKGTATTAPMANGAATSLPMQPRESDEHDEIVDIGRPIETESPRKLIVTINGEDFDYPIVNDVMTIGRGRTNDIRIASHFVSRVHAKIRTDEGATIIEDAGSKNGVLVNQTRVNRRVLHDGDVVSIGGDFLLRFVDGAA